MNVINEQRSWRGEVDTHRGRKRGKGDGGTTALVGIPPAVLGANLDDVCEGRRLRATTRETSYGNRAQRLPMQRRSKRAPGRGSKEREDKFPRLDVEHSCKSGDFLQGKRPRV